MGYAALDANTTANYNVAIGKDALTETTTGENNTAVGTFAGNNNSTGENLVAVGYSALLSATASNNTGVGRSAGQNITSGTNNLMLGKDAGITGSPGGNITTSSNNIVLGDENIGNLFCAQTSISTSDRRDKNSITNFTGGLSWINAMNPVTYKWDRRSWYIDADATPEDLLAVTPDGTHVNPSLEIGLVAQDVLDIEQANGYGSNNDNSLLVNLTEDETRYGLDYTKIVPHIYPIILKDPNCRKEIMEFLKSKKIETGIHYYPNHLLKYLLISYKKNLLFRYFLPI
mgnify:CR=1 FL=1